MVQSDLLIHGKPLKAPRAKKIPTERFFHGHTYVDNYEWIRDRNDPDLIKLLNEENDYAHEILAPLKPLRDKLVSEFKYRMWETDYTLPIRYDDWWYYTRTFKDRQYSAMYRIRVTNGSHPTQEEFVNEVLVWDGNNIGDGLDFFNCGGFLPAPNGKYGAMLIDVTGDEHYSLRIFDMETGLILDDSVRNAGYGLCWTADSTGVAYTRVDETWRQSKVMLHTIGEFSDSVLYDEKDERFDVVLAPCRNHKWMIVHSVSLTSSETTMISADDHERRYLVYPRHEKLEYYVEPAGDQLLIVHNANNPDFELASAPMRASQPDEWLTILSPQPGERIQGVDAFAKHAVVSMRSNGSSQLRVLRREKPLPFAKMLEEHNTWGNTDHVPLAKTWREATPIPQENNSYIEIYPDRYWDSNAIIYTEESTLLPPTQKAYNPETGTIRVLKSLDVPHYDPSLYRQERVDIEARDGVKIPLTLVYRADVTPNQENPGYITGYGSYEISNEPAFNVQRFTFLDRGVVMAIAHVRGGGEYGRAWYEGGKFLNKKNTFNDFVDCARWLVESGWCSGGRLVAEGASAGGLLIGVAINEAPELFCAVHAAVPFVDSLTTILKPELPLTVGEWEEWGNPIESQEIYEYMASYAPIENVKSVEYPAIFTTTSLNDIRVLYVEPTKWVQVLRDTVVLNEERPIVERIDMASGHTGKSGRYDKWSERAEEMAWLLYHLGVWKPGMEVAEAG
ncbi:prolyl oligopeptidase family serine peptidase [Actinotignum urinale]|uniref:S9 family peptidase n=1 Tax=Actinotignum urinale TaxID=190146 RepID=UPI002A8154F5|nr:prolyl oligopeptidase family serine peptidase [Actinotignum urinale]MDY5128467.1 prolyl oligopeptidase family serine peptidase [Actinotignum urinale]